MSFWVKGNFKKFSRIPQTFLGVVKQAQQGGLIIVIHFWPPGEYRGDSLVWLHWKHLSWSSDYHFSNLDMEELSAKQILYQMWAAQLKSLFLSRTLFETHFKVIHVKIRWMWREKLSSFFIAWHFVLTFIFRRMNPSDFSTIGTLTFLLIGWIGHIHGAQRANPIQPHWSTPLTLVALNDVWASVEF